MGTIGLITRSRATGYKAFPDTNGSWWDKHKKLMRLEAPTFVIEAIKKGSVQFYLAGITSQQRTDHVGTPIRYSLFGMADTDEELRSLTSAAESLCDDKKLRDLARWLDDTVGDSVEAWMESNLGLTVEAPFLTDLHSSWVERARDVAPLEELVGDRRILIGHKNHKTWRLIRCFMNELSSKGHGTILFLNLADQDNYELVHNDLLLGITRGVEDSLVLEKKNYMARNWTELDREKKVIITVGVGVAMMGILYLMFRYTDMLRR